ncbi:response regulator transcription factor [Streptomyces sp. NPDC050256]|uniref:response regulator transcription factor n=1 Tax=unclassified Streptomyces TaxID=2593676 RepID=UPI0037B33426
MRTAIVARRPFVLIGLEHLLTTHSPCDVVFTSAAQLPGPTEKVEVLIIEDELADEVPDLPPRGVGAPTVIRLRADTAPDDVLRQVAGIRTRQSAAAKVATRSVTMLSPREQEVLHFIASGMTHAQVARRIGISSHTVDTYVKRVRSKFSVGNKAELTRIALGLIPL